MATVIADLSHIGVIENPANPSSRSVVMLAQEAGRNTKLVVIPAEAQNSQELESAFVKLTKDGVGAVMFVPDQISLSSESGLRNSRSEIGCHAFSRSVNTLQLVD